MYPYKFPKKKNKLKIVYVYVFFLNNVNPRLCQITFDKSLLLSCVTLDLKKKTIRQSIFKLNYPFVDGNNNSRFFVSIISNRRPAHPPEIYNNNCYFV